ncbi:hypothetical protein BASA50_001420 [Batrachochytrium salamandrivorans]|uniref:non-specific serine/threonine protein kinase n=1 Tax=Batrachochytrium salamandrivorans TaxID=1357716 RepID=A0ABQ8EV99_9FUNG|nr:hypothetical protein BASA50_001420 [Batrachochytrium salamandrivorans]KAH9258844.1 hypothetical protein BASA81_002908 [Batrachochytrium salamandrivorans]
MFDPLLWVLLHFITPHYAGQTTQGDTNDGDAVDQASGSRDATILPLRVYPLSLKRPLQESNILDQSDASSSADFQPEEECKGKHGIRKISKSCPHQQSPPELRPSTLHDPHQSDEMPLPVRVEESEAESYRWGQNAEQYNEFIAGETKYFKSEYSYKRKLGEGKSGVVFLATKKSDGMEVAYKSIPKTKVDDYTLESIPPPRCHLPNPSALSDEQSVEQCMSSRPPNLLFPYEFAIHMYLSRTGHENPYVPMGVDYFILKDKFMLIMEYFDEKWVTLSSYAKERKRLDIEEARDILREIVNAVISLKRQGVVHGDLTGMSQ